MGGKRGLKKIYPPNVGTIRPLRIQLEISPTDWWVEIITKDEIKAWIVKFLTPQKVETPFSIFSRGYNLSNSNREKEQINIVMRPMGN